MTTTGLSGTLLAFLAKWITVLVFTGSLVVELSSAQNVTDAKDLRTQLFVTDAYDYRVRPVSNQSQHIGERYHACFIFLSSSRSLFYFPFFLSFAPFGFLSFLPPLTFPIPFIHSFVFLHS